MPTETRGEDVYPSAQQNRPITTIVEPNVCPMQRPLERQSNNPACDGLSDLSNDCQIYPKLSERILRPSSKKRKPVEISQMSVVLEASDTGIYPNSLLHFQRPSLTPPGPSQIRMASGACGPPLKRQRAGRPKGSKNKAPKKKQAKNADHNGQH